MKRIALVSLLAFCASACATTQAGFDMLAPVVCSPAGKLAANEAVINSPICKGNAVTPQCLGAQFTVDQIFMRVCASVMNPAAREATPYDGGADLRSVLVGVGYTEVQAAMKVARLPRD